MNKQQFSLMLQQKAAKSRKVEQFAEKAQVVLLEIYEPHRRTGRLAASVEIQKRVNKKGVELPFVAVTHHAAKWIDNGHWAGEGANTVWVEGIHGVSRAARIMKRG